MTNDNDTCDSLGACPGISGFTSNRIGSWNLFSDSLSSENQVTWISGKYVHRKIKLRGAREDVEIIHAPDALVYFYPKTFCIVIIPTGKGMITGESIHFGPDTHWPINLVCECRNDISIHRWLAGYAGSDGT